MSGPVFRYETPRPGPAPRVPRRSASSCSATAGPAADAEVIWLADWALRRGRASPSRRSGSATSGLILEMLAPLGPARRRRRRPWSRCSARPPPRGGASGRWSRAWSSSPAGSRRATRPRIVPAGRPGRRRRRRPAVPAPRPGRHRPAVGPRDHRPAAAEVGPRPLAARGAGAGPRPGPRPGRPARAGRRRSSTRLERDYAALAPESVAALRELVAMLGSTGSTPTGSSSTSGSAGGSASTRR